jgi:glycosyltransferase involved in cell wall biosynthesis
VSVCHWHILTGEYPSQAGGVSDYTRLVACGLAAAGDRVHVWAPPAGPTPVDRGVTVRRLPDPFGPRSLLQLDRELGPPAASRRLLVQYVPHAFGAKALNVPFTLWLRWRGRGSLWVMFHEVAFPITRRQGLRRNALGIVTRGMAALAAGAAERIFISIPAWEAWLRPYVGEGVPITWLPVPSSIPVAADPRASALIRDRYGNGRALVGHFGTYGELTRHLLADALRVLLSTEECAVLLIGRRSHEAAEAMISSRPEWRDRVRGTGALAPESVSHHVAACDLMLQPYPDGVSTRRTSVMVALAHGRPTVTTDGALSEPFWRDSQAVVLAPAGDATRLAAAASGLLHDRTLAQRTAAAARSLYEARFDLAHTIAALRSSDDGPRALRAVS